MSDGAATPLGGDPADALALAADNRLIRGVRWRLVLWSGLTTLVVLAILGIALYAVAARTLEANGIKQLDARAAAFRQHPDPGGGPGQGFAFGGSSSGTFALLADDTGAPIALGRPVIIPDGLPVVAGIDAARAAGADVRVVTVGDTSVRVRTEQVDSRIGTLYIQVIQDRTAEQQIGRASCRDRVYSSV